MRALLLAVLILPVLALADTSSTTVAVVTVACSDGVDNDGDAIIDYPLDPGCASAADTDEIDLSFSCADSLDNDGDSLVDFPADPGCDSATDQTEENIPAGASYGGVVSGLIQLFRPIVTPSGTPSFVIDTDATPIPTPDDISPVYVPPVRRVTAPAAGSSSTSTVEDDVGVILATFAGVVRDASGQPVTQAEVELFAKLPDGTLVPVEVGGGAQVARLTNATGYYRLDQVPAGDYSIRISAPGYQSVVVQGDMNALQELVLQKESGISLLLSVATDGILAIPLCGESSSCADPSWVPILSLIVLVLVQIAVVRLLYRL
ncbi:MAG: carboxypeptidase regulatory-like domain-containing protein [Candidatus Pacebacteria bacterium]|nr:carboxypeptidase regulatory-like domain-containing protein [Candidatus Paceibacterota bacterium]